MRRRAKSAKILRPTINPSSMVDASVRIGAGGAGVPRGYSRSCFELDYDHWQSAARKPQSRQ